MRRSRKGGIFKRGRTFKGKRNRRIFKKFRKTHRLNYPRLSRGGYRLS